VTCGLRCIATVVGIVYCCHIVNALEGEEIVDTNGTFAGGSPGTLAAGKSSGEVIEGWPHSEHHVHLPGATAVQAAVGKVL
jgi:hypothetical protein